MKDQHEKIKGYRDLSQQEIDLMNRIKAHAEETKLLLLEVHEMRTIEFDNDIPPPGLSMEDLSESRRCLVHARTNLQQGYMWFVRGVALPQSF